jgi:hypothetical protein
MARPADARHGRPGSLRCSTASAPRTRMINVRAVSSAAPFEPLLLNPFRGKRAGGRSRLIRKGKTPLKIEACSFACPTAHPDMRSARSEHRPSSCLMWLRLYGFVGSSPSDVWTHCPGAVLAAGSGRRRRPRRYIGRRLAGGPLLSSTNEPDSSRARSGGIRSASAVRAEF